MNSYKYFLLAISTPLLLVQKTNAQVVIPVKNLISNGDFMSRDPLQRPLRWFTGMGLQTATLTGVEHHGKNKDDHSLKVSDTSDVNSLVVRTEKHIADPGTDYEATAWVKTKSGQPASFTIEFWDQNNKIIGSKTITPEAGNDWQKLTLNLKAPDKCTHATVSISTKKAGTGLSFWDDVSLTYNDHYNTEIKTGIHEMFMDDYRIEKMVDVQRVINQGKKSKVLIKATEPWEGNSAYIYGTVLQNEPAGTGYRMWYCAYSNATYYTCYATSKDGINWVKPKLGVIDYKGSKQNNICRVGGGTIVYDPDDKDASRRYKLMSFDGSKEFFGYNVYFSPDGFHWTHYPKPVLPYGDVSNVAYDREKHLFIATTKQRMLISNTSVTPNKNDRMAFVSVSRDFINWTAPGEPNSLFTLAVEGDYADDQLVMSKGGLESNIYGMPVYPYQDVYIGLPWMFDITTYTNGDFAPYGDGVIQPQLAVSRDLRHWSRTVREPVLPVGKAGDWDDGTLYTASNMLVNDKEMTVYFGAMNLPHGGSAGTLTQYARIAKATWRRDGFASLYNAGSDVGTIITKAITFNGSQLKVNAALANGGSLKIEILDRNNVPLKGYEASHVKPITKDQLAATVQWGQGADLSKLKGQEIKLKFYLVNGNLYSYWFE